MKDFALIGVAGFIAPRHLAAIKNTGNNLVAALDKVDSVGILDSYFPDANFFVEYERFDRHIGKLARNGKPIDYLSVCSPNYLHDSHIRFGLRNNATVICEKPLVLNPWNVEALEKIQNETGKKVFTILQLRLHPDILKLKQLVFESDPEKIFDIDLTYITARGKWYYSSWKSDISKSGGIATNIGIHFFDMLIWLFGKVVHNIVHIHEHDRAAGFLQLERARVRWFLSIDEDTLPVNLKKQGRRTYRSIKIENSEIELKDNYTNLHTKSYQAIISGNGFSLIDVWPSIELVHSIRTQMPTGIKREHHPYASLPLRQHPFI